MTDASRLRSPLSKARGLGAAHAGARHWWLERMTALALIPLSLWFLSGLISHLGASREAAAAWLAEPATSILLSLLMLTMLLHTKMGISVIIEDYVHTHWKKHALVILKDACVYALLAMSLFAIIKLHFMGIKV